MRRELTFATLVLILSAGLPAFAETKIYLKTWQPPPFTAFTTPQNLTGAPDGQFAGMPVADYPYGYRAIYDLGATVSTNRLEVVYKGLGTIRLQLAMTEAELRQDYCDFCPNYDFWTPNITAQPGQGADTVRTVIITNSTGPRRFRYVAVYLFNQWWNGDTSGAWLDSLAALITTPPEGPPGPPLTGTFTTIGYPGASQTVLTGIDRYGQILGWFRLGPSDFARGFIWYQGVFQLLPEHLTMSSLYPAGLNNNDMIVGYYTMAGWSRGFLYRYSSRQYSWIDYPYPSAETTAEGVNAMGEIAGSYRRMDAPGIFGYILFGSTWQTLTYPGAWATEARGIAGAYGGSTTRLVGLYRTKVSTYARGFFWSISGFVPFDFPDAAQTTPSGIVAQVPNASIRIVGAYLDGAGKSHGFLLDQGPYGIFRTIDVPGAGSTNASAINESGIIVGSFNDPACACTRGFRLTP